MLQQPGIVRVVDERRLYENGWHLRAAQHGEAAILFDAAVWEIRIERVDMRHDILLDMGSQTAARRFAVEAVRLAAASAAGIDMNRNEKIRIPHVGRGNDIGISRRLAEQIVALEHLDGMAICHEIAAADRRHLRSQLGFGQAKFLVDGAGIRATACRMAGIQENTQGSTSVQLLFQFIGIDKRITSPALRVAQPNKPQPSQLLPGGDEGAMRQARRIAEPVFRYDAAVSFYQRVVKLFRFFGEQRFVDGLAAVHCKSSFLSNLQHLLRLPVRRAASAAASGLSRAGRTPCLGRTPRRAPRARTAS